MIAGFHGRHASLVPDNYKQHPSFNDTDYSSLMTSHRHIGNIPSHVAKACSLQLLRMIIIWPLLLSEEPAKNILGRENILVSWVTLRLVISRHGALRGDNTHLPDCITRHTHTSPWKYFVLQNWYTHDRNKHYRNNVLDILIIIFDYTFVGWDSVSSC